MLIDISDDTPLVAVPEINLTPSSTQNRELSPSFKSDDVPLCLSDTPASNKTIVKDDDEPLLSLGDPQQNLTLNLLIQGQNSDLPPLISPPLPADTNQSVAGSHPISQSDSLMHNKISQSEPVIASTPTEHKHFESFLSYLDESVDNVFVDPAKHAQDLVQEVESAVLEAEIKVEKRKESLKASERSASDLLAQYQTGVYGYIYDKLSSVASMNFLHWLPHIRGATDLY